MRLAIFSTTKNNEDTIEFWIQWYKERVPIATFYIYDQDSTDNTVKIAEEKGCVIRQYKYRFKDIEDWKNNCWKNIPTDAILLTGQNELVEVNPMIFQNCTIIQAKGYNIKSFKEINKEERNADLDNYCIFDAGSIISTNFESDRCNPQGFIRVGEKQVDLYRIK